MDILKWALDNWPTVVATLGIGGGGGIAAKKITDKKQDAKISKIEKRISELEKTVANLEKDVQTNTLFDNQFREQMKDEYNGIKAEIKGVKATLEKILFELLK